MLRSFKKGEHLDEKKISSLSPIEDFGMPKTITLHLKQHLGKCVDPLVKAGDLVKRYQVIGDFKDCMCAPVHSPVSGKVLSIVKKPHPSGGSNEAVVIEPDNKNTTAPYRRNSLSELSQEKIIELIRDAGIVGLGGASCPTDLKLICKKRPELYIINGCECEPYITADHRVMLEYAKEVVSGTRVLLKASGAPRAIIAVEDNKKDAYEMLKAESASYKEIEVALVETKYPQGAEKMLIYTLTRKKVPLGGLPIGLGIIVNNVATAKAVHDAVIDGKPLVERVVTVTGDVEKPGNFLVPIGTGFKELIERCKPIGEPKKVMNGGPMMGIAVDDLSVPVVKGTSCILVLSQPEIQPEDACIRCGRCVYHCPMNISPITIARYAKNERYADARDVHAMACFECGICSYTCPSHIPLLHYIRVAKKVISKKC